MTDIEIAKNNLTGHTICLCKDGDCLFSEKRGISPMMKYIEDQVNLSGYSVADLVVGKAVAMLFVKCNVKEVYAKTLSQSGKAVLEKNHIPCTYDTLCEYIINRVGTDICPMEKTVACTEDIAEAYLLLKSKIKEM